MSERRAPEWARSAERGNRFALQLMAFIAVVCGRRVARLVLHPITWYFLLFSPGPRRHSKRYLQRALGRPARLRDLYRHFYAFSVTVLDRIYFARGRADVFDLQVRGTAQMDELVAQGRGAILLGAHMGSFEALHTVGTQRPGLRVAMAMFPDNARMIHGLLQAIAPNFHLDIIAIGRPQSTLEVRDWLDGGGLVGLLGDRTLADAGARGGLIELPFLGSPARFHDGPLRLAMLLKRRVMFMVALYRGGRTYDVRFEPLADFTSSPADPAQRDNLVHDALAAYVARLEALCREAPYNWFNFFDFWNDDARP